MVDAETDPESISPHVRCHVRSFELAVHVLCARRPEAKEVSALVGRCPTEKPLLPTFAQAVQEPTLERLDVPADGIDTDSFTLQKALNGVEAVQRAGVEGGASESSAVCGVSNLVLGPVFQLCETGKPSRVGLAYHRSRVGSA